MSNRRPDRDKHLQRLLKLDEPNQIAALRSMFGEPEYLDEDADDDLDGIERVARLALHGTKGVPRASGEYGLNIGGLVDVLLKMNQTISGVLRRESATATGEDSLIAQLQRLVDHDPSAYEAVRVFVKSHLAKKSKRETH